MRGLQMDGGNGKRRSIIIPSVGLSVLAEMGPRRPSGRVDSTGSVGNPREKGREEKHDVYLGKGEVWLLQRLSLRSENTRRLGREGEKKNLTELVEKRSRAATVGEADCQDVIDLGEGKREYRTKKRKERIARIAAHRAQRPRGTRKSGEGEKVSSKVERGSIRALPALERRGAARRGAVKKKGGHGRSPRKSKSDRRTSNNERREFSELKEEDQLRRTAGGEKKSGGLGDHRGVYIRTSSSPRVKRKSTN